jgi:uncharacterized protein
VKKLQDYNIPFSGLKEGMHEFLFTVDNSFFEYFENPDVHGGNLKVDISLTKKNSFMELVFSLRGTLRITCDRCLDEFDTVVDAKELLYVRFGEDYTELEDNVIIIPREDNRINVSQYIYEFAILNLPLKKVHPMGENGEPECNPEMLAILKKHSTELKGTNQIWDD